ncbi:MAG: cation diffusion facilitator family transporter [Salinivirgaceae bacterium]|nr:cation diffusion facilitator family transporter [Salinivirgaceae bacterium]
MNELQYKHGKIVGWFSILGNTILFILKYIVAFLTGSVALMADAWHTLSDSVSSIVLLIGIKWSTKPADDDHPFGHGRAELISSIIIGFILGAIALNFGWEGIDRLQNRVSVEYGSLAIWVTVLSIIAKEGMAQFNFYHYRRSQILSIKADGWHHRSDSISSIVILGGILLGQYFWWIDGALGIIVAVLIGYTAYKIISEGVNPLLGEEVPMELKAQISIIADKIAGYDTYVHHMHMHRYGTHTELTFHVRLPKKCTFEEVEQLINAIQKEVKTNMNIHATIHAQILHLEKINP